MSELRHESVHHAFFFFFFNSTSAILFSAVQNRRPTEPDSPWLPLVSSFFSTSEIIASVRTRIGLALGTHSRGRSFRRSNYALSDSLLRLPYVPVCSALLGRCRMFNCVCGVPVCPNQLVQGMKLYLSKISCTPSRRRFWLCVLPVCLNYRRRMNTKGNLETFG